LGALLLAPLVFFPVLILIFVPVFLFLTQVLGTPEQRSYLAKYQFLLRLFSGGSELLTALVHLL
jgi:hypothetical protein